jgi:O-antigen/teichoic acid export membrane protein
MNQRKFILNLILIIVVNLMVKPLYIFGIERNIQNLIGAADYGLFYSLFNLSFIISILLDPGITNYNNRHIAQNEHLLSSSFSTISSAKLFLSFVYLIFIGIYGIVVNFNSIEWSMLIMLAFGQIFNSFTLYNRSNLAGLHKFQADTFVSILDKLLMILLCIPVIYLGYYKSQFSIFNFITIQTISLLGAAIVSFMLVLKHTSSFNLKFSFSGLKKILSESYPYAILAMLMLIYTKADTVLLKELNANGNEEVGIYAAAYRLIDALNMIAVLFAGLLYPIFSKMIKEKLDIEPLTKIAFSLLVIPSIVFALYSIFYAEEIMRLLYIHNISESTAIFKILIIAFVFICNGYIFGTLLTANGSIKLLNQISIFGVFVNCLLNILIIPTYGAIGSAYISLLTFVLVTSTQLIISFKKFRFSIRISYILRALFSLILVFFIAYISLSLDFNWLWKYFAGMGISIIILMISRLVPLKQLTLLIKQDKIV